MTKKIMFNDKYCLMQAVLDGTKTMTRRAVPQSLLDKYDVWYEDFIYKPVGEEEYLSVDEYVLKRTAYKVGEVVAIAQPYKDVIECMAEHSDLIINADGSINSEYRAGWVNKMFTKPSLLPHHIRITDVKVERLQDISDEDIMCEGIYRFGKFVYAFERKTEGYLSIFPTAREAFACLIDKISGKGTWESNPWVVAYSFELVD